MRPADDPNADYKTLVERGYDLCAAAYEEARRRDPPPELALLTERLRDGARVLDIGCGAGVPIAQALARRFAVTGVDISKEQIRRARANVPEGTFIQGDIMTVSLPSGGFDAAVAFYTLFHLPREEHPELLRRVRDWLAPGGYLLATLNRNADAAYTEDDFYGVTMYWSNYGLDDYRAILGALGLAVIACSTIGHGYATDADAPAEEHPLLLARYAGS